LFVTTKTSSRAHETVALWLTLSDRARDRFGLPYNRLLECQLTFSAIQCSAAWLSENLYAFLRPRTVLFQVVGQRIALANRADDCWLGQIGRHVSVASLLFAITFLREVDNNSHRNRRIDRTSQNDHMPGPQTPGGQDSIQASRGRPTRPCLLPELAGPAAEPPFTRSAC